MTYTVLRKRLLSGAAILSCLVMSVGAFAADLDVTQLRTATDAGDIEAARTLGDALLWGYGGVDQDPAEAARLLGLAAEQGDARAQTILGKAYLWGMPLSQDKAKADQLLSAAADQGETEALRVLGEQLISGYGLPRDVARGLPLLEAAVAKGDAEAKVILGKFYLYGKPLVKDRARALELFEEAAVSGNGEGLAAYGSDMMWSERGWQAAQDYLERAGDLGETSAWVSLAEGAMYGYLGPQSRSKFDAYAERAREADEERIAVLDAQRSTWGISMRASGSQTLETLQAAAEEGNVEALRSLLSLTRDGNHYNIRKDTDGARALLERYGDMLTPLERTQYALSFDAASHRMAKDYPAVVAAIEAQPEVMTESFGVELYKANPNIAFYMLQQDMRDSGLYSGKLDGLAGPQTLKGIKALCEGLMDQDNCGDRVLEAGVIAKLLAR